MLESLKRIGSLKALGGRVSLATAAAIAVLFGAAPPALAQFHQQGPKLVGSGYANPASQGAAVALSGDGNTAIIGGPGDGPASAPPFSSHVGAMWIFNRAGGIWAQQGSKLSGDQGAQGSSVAISADGSTVMVGDPFASPENLGDGPFGAAWVFTQSNGVWSQQGSQLIINDMGSFPGVEFGRSVALSADGNTAIGGGPLDSMGKGAAFVFTRADNVWTQQAKLVGDIDVRGFDAQGEAVALSADGNTAAVGGTGAASGGAVWIFTRSGGVWTQQAKLTGTGTTGASQGSSVSLSADGNTLLEGGPADSSGAGAVWVFTRSNGVWTQQGAKLVGSGASPSNSSVQVMQGSSLSLSADGNTAVEGGPGDDNNIGAVWVFTRSGGTWNQRGPKLVGTGYAPGLPVYQGTSVALSADGNTAIIGGPGDANDIGASWAFVRSASAETSSHDFNGDGVSDILWRQSGGGVPAIWLMNGGQNAGTALSLAGLPQAPGWFIAATRDFTGNGDADILWLDGGGDLALWLMNGASVGSGISIGNIGAQWQVAGTGDFNGDSVGDILWRNTSTGEVAIWLMSNGALSSGITFGAESLIWQIVGTGDFNGDGTSDILWRNASTGDLAIWFLQNGQFSSGIDLGAVSLSWTVVGTGDFDGDGVSDILWRDSAGDLAIWLMNSSGQMASGTTITGIPTAWSVAETGDFDGNGTSDILWIDGSDDVAIWLMNGLSVSSYLSLGNVGTGWTVQGQNAD